MYESVINTCLGSNHIIAYWTDKATLSASNFWVHSRNVSPPLTHTDALSIHVTTRTQLFAALSERVKSEKDEFYLHRLTRLIPWLPMFSQRISEGDEIYFRSFSLNLTLQLLRSVWVINQKKEFFKLINQRMLPSICKMAAFRYSLSVLKIYSIHNMHYRFLVLAVNIGTHPKKTVVFKSLRITIELSNTASSRVVTAKRESEAST